MSAPFPFGFPLATAIYLAVYIVTLVVHVLFMNYVLAGSSYVLLTSMTRRPSESTTVWRKLLVDWLSFATGLAITAGVAPLLFVQILYQKQFYSSNLLLSHRWMSILPVLLVCFYLLYLLKTNWLAARGALWRIGVCGVIFVGFSFIAWSWTENHLLSLDQAEWASFYGQGKMLYRNGLLPSRLAMWFIGAFATLACMLMWQVKWTPGLSGEVTGAAWRQLGSIAMAGIVLAGVACAIFLATIPAATRSHVLGWTGGPYLAIAMLGAVLQLAGWWKLVRERRPSTSSQAMITAGCVATIGGMAVIREVVRLAASDLPAIEAHHREALNSGGLLLFLFFFAANAAVIIWCGVQVRRAVTGGLSHEPNSQ
ncbi:hypothetical protein Pan44_28420 [Caulifigura coniformis]|uniref:Uncharacterized protein n=1 Tax=Caulifigura coniformis TaxID=2527983 RepID=A0A517SF86_9PLAN|nr:hypothetical protein [Caulifigura coniformis]QDT54804.1 hypothetical protein Pan44_28420 [Caulifigura coniformis]